MCLNEDDETDPAQTVQDLRGLLSTDPHIYTLDRMHRVLFALGKYLEERSLVERFRPSKNLDNAIGKAVGGWLIKGIQASTFQHRALTELRYNMQTPRRPFSVLY